MNAKIQIPCEIQKSLVFTTIYRVVGKRKSDGSFVVLHYYLNKDDAVAYKKLAKVTYPSLYSMVFVDSNILWL